MSSETRMDTQKTPMDFKFIARLGEGAYSQVFRCREVGTNATFAIKVLEKEHLMKHQKMGAIIREKKILEFMTKDLNGHPFISSLYSNFEDKDRIYMKPENVLIKKDGHIVIADFGSAKTTKFEEEEEEEIQKTSSEDSDEKEDVEQEKEQERRTTFVGTALYISPEMLNDGAVGAKSDIWALGCMIYEFLAGKPPFTGINQYQQTRKVHENNITFDDFPESAKISDPKLRITTDQLMAHQFYKDINWKTITTTKPTVPLEKYSLYKEREEVLDEDVLPGFDLARLIKLSDGLPIQPKLNAREKAEREAALDVQRRDNDYHQLLDGYLVLKQGILHKKRGFFARKRMFLLTDGPQLVYVDPSNKKARGKVPWTPCMTIEYVNPKLFNIHTPGRTYILYDYNKTAEEWCRAIEDVRVKYAAQIKKIYDKGMEEGNFHEIYGKIRPNREKFTFQADYSKLNVS
ncbi:Protein CBG15618 [Caenorhabditis briggsae]|uniref:3-phosphoinositide-dependent protein kinase 1 n=1 Tax=Caenorhabditis briggsae TaxID=6238 RepID=A8XME2_CAEBR|nr:Protein CBG15618 [Caenorhabditis briggsae]CAP33817.2 Protein CBG15618 [Caenorhabditis briggsae]